jgi:hypothetical protein
MNQVVICESYDLSGVTQEEYQFQMDGGEDLSFRIFDDSVPARIGRQWNTTYPVDGWHFVCGTYDGSLNILHKALGRWLDGQ